MKWEYSQPQENQSQYISLSLVKLLYVQCHSVHHTTNDKDKIAAILKDKLQGEFCYVQTRNGKIVSIHYSPTESEEGINVKRGIAGAFQANFDKLEAVEESDPGSTHVSHYRYIYGNHTYIKTYLTITFSQFFKNLQ